MHQRFLALLLGISICVVFAQPLQAQTAGSSFDPDKQYSLFVSRGVVSGVEVGPSLRVAPYGSWQIGGACELFLADGLAVGGELARAIGEVKGNPITYTSRTFNGSEASNTIAANAVQGWGSLNLAYHFKGLSHSDFFVPFVTAGVTIFARDGLAEAKNFGGGISLWRNRHR